MPGALLDANTTVMCAHGANAKAAMPNPRVQTGGAATVALASPFLVSGCSNVAPGGAPLPCVTATFLMGAARVTSGGQPLLLQDGQALAIPTGTPLSIIPTGPPRAKGQ